MTFDTGAVGAGMSQVARKTPAPPSVRSTRMRRNLEKAFMTLFCLYV